MDDERSVPHPLPDDTSDAATNADQWISLRNLTDKLKVALEKCDAARTVLSQQQPPEEREKKEAELYAKAMEVSGWPLAIRAIKDPKLRAEKTEKAGLSLDAEKVTRIINEDPEHQKIVKLGQERKQAEADIGDLGKKLCDDLVRLHLRNPDDQTIKAVLENVKGLSKPLTPSDAKTMIQWLEDLASASLASVKPEKKTSSARHRKDEDGLAGLKALVKKMHQEGCSPKEICRRLHNHPRPPRAKWRDLAWDAAYRDRNHQNAVKTWISKTVSEPSRLL